jgi:hypothetical protein
MSAQRHDQLTTWLLAGAVAVLVAGWGFHQVARANSDLPPVAGFVTDAVTLYLPAVEGGPAAGWLAHPAPVNRAWKLFWLQAGGQWDARVLALAGAVLQALAFGALMLQFTRSTGRSTAFALGVALVALTTLAPLAPGADSAAPSIALLLSLLQLQFATSERGWRRGAGFAAGLLNVLASNLGAAAAIALLVAALLRRRTTPVATHWRELVDAGVLVVLGLTLIVLRRPEDVPGWASFAAWPRVSPVLAAAIWMPAILFVGSRRGLGTHDALLPLALWSMATIAVAPFATETPADVTELLIAGVAVNIACALALVKTGAAGAPRDAAATDLPLSRAILAGLWLILVADALLHPPAGRAAPSRAPAVDSAVTAALRDAVLGSELRASADEMGISEAQRTKLTQSLANPQLQQILPASIRPPLTVKPAAGTQGFRGNGAPDLPARDGLPSFGTWQPEGARDVGEFVSEPLQTRFSLLQFRVAGELRPPDTSLALRTNAGKDVTPLESGFTSDTRWKRVNLTAPADEFRIVARDASADRWIAFTAPHEVSRLGWLAGKLARTSPWLLMIAAIAGSAACVRWLRVTPAADADAWLRSFPWQAVPLVAIMAYAVVWSHHLDPTAGPNDAGGYMNLAKMLRAGEVIGTPRTLPNDAQASADVSPYVPGTFWPTADGKMVPEYPPGLPMIFAAAALPVPLENAVPMVILLQLGLGLYFTRRLALAFGFSDGWSWLAAFLLGMNAVYVWQGVQPQSDGPAAVWVTAAVGWAWTSRTRPWHALLAGAATALAVLIRPTNVLVAVPVLICLIGHWRQLALWIAGGIPGAVWLVWYNRELYGAVVATGYGDMSTNFGAQFVLPTLKSYAKWLPLYFSPIVILGFAGIFVRQENLRARLVLATWVGVFAVFYAFYWCTWDNWYNMRFVLPAAPAMILLGLFFLRDVAERWNLRPFTIDRYRRSFLPSAAIIAVLFGVLVFATLKENVMYWMRSNKRHQVMATWVNGNLPRNSVVYARIASNVLYYYTDFIVVRPDNARARSPEFLSLIAASGRPVHAVTYRVEGRDRVPPGEDPATAHPAPDVPGSWRRMVTLYDGDIVVWEREK